MSSCIAWLLVLEALGFCLTPAVARIFRGRHGLGLGFARLIGLMLCGYVVWLGASLHLFAFDATTVRLGCALALLALPAWRRLPSATGISARELRREYLFDAGVFYAAFAIFFAVMWGGLAIPIGERALNLSLFTSIDRAAHFPPPDLWCAGRLLNYYYFGHYLGVFPGKAVGLSPLQSYCLFWATLPALLASGAYSLTRMLLPRDARWAGLIGPLLIVGIGNLSVVRDLVVHGRFFQPAFMFQMTRVIPHTINESPLTSAMVAEAHAHLIALPLTALFLAACYQWLRKMENPLRGAWDWIAFLLPGVVMGFNLAINAWDQATHGAFLLFVSVVAACRNRRIVRPLIGAAAMFALAWLLFAPFHLNYDRPPSGLEWLLSRTTTRLYDLFIHPGALFIAAVVMLLFSYKHNWRHGNFARRTVSSSAITLIMFALFYALRPQRFQLHLFFLGVSALALLYVRDRLKSAPWIYAYPALLLLFSVAVLWGCELLNVRVVVPPEDFRQNTVMRFYPPVWVMLGAVVAQAMHRSWRAWRWRKRRLIEQPRMQLTFLVMMCALIALSIVQPATGAWLRFKHSWRAVSLDAASHLRFQHNGTDFEAIHWMRENLPPETILIEHPGIAPYGMARYSMGTGLPTALGGTHKLQQRNVPDTEIEARRRDVLRIYTSNDWAEIEALLRKYGATCVVYPLASGPLGGVNYYDPEKHPSTPENFALFREHARTAQSWPNLVIFSLNF
ncbi:hypothetical protein JXA32_00835 [Candidatus Sumerlaeota bacterium]|nr:hypothetical protein [Candidatus Sumerlaeota bacterium]